MTLPKKGEAAPAKAKEAAAPAKDAAPTMPKVGDKLKAKFTDGEMYNAEVVLISEGKKKKKTPVKVHFVGYGEEEDLWVSLDDLAPAKKGKKKKGKKATEPAEKKEAAAPAPAPEKKAKKPRKKKEKKTEKTEKTEKAEKTETAA